VGADVPPDPVADEKVEAAAALTTPSPAAEPA
jgi:hypothetical protein